MAAATFSDDAYNKFLQEGAGTLIGNWLEERSIREATGEGRTVPQRHIPRAGLFTESQVAGENSTARIFGAPPPVAAPTGGPRKQDNTFERIYGPKFKLRDVPMSKTIGGGEDDPTGEEPITLMLQGEGRITKVGAKELAAKLARREIAEQEVQAEDAERDRQGLHIGEIDRRQRGHTTQPDPIVFETTTATHFRKPDETQIERPTYLRKSFQKELQYGPPAHPSRALANAGLDIQSNVHYSNMECVTHNRMMLADDRTRIDMRVSASTGISAFGKNTEFTKPINEFTRGLQKDLALDQAYDNLKGTQPLRTLGGAAPRAGAFGDVPSLTGLKDSIHQKIRDTWSTYGYVTLRRKLWDCSSQEGVVMQDDVIKVFRNDVGLTEEDASTAALSVWIGMMESTTRGAVRIVDLLTSLRPALSNEKKKQAMAMFESLGPGQDGCVALGSWVEKVEDAELQSVIIDAFGADEPSQIADMPLTFSTFVELITDIAAIDASGLGSAL